MRLGENIYSLRTARSMSQGDLANALDVSRQSVSKWENNSAVPELDKLMKMSELFGVTLDELVGKSAATAPSQPAASAEAANPEAGLVLDNGGVPVQMTIGLLLICLGIGVIFWLAVGAWLTGKSVLLGVVIGITMILCGILCFAVAYPYVYWGWCIWGAYLLYMFVLTQRWESQALLLILAGILLIALLGWTVYAHRKGLIHIPIWLQITGSILLIALIVLFLMNISPPAAGHATEVLPG